MSLKKVHETTHFLFGGQFGVSQTDAEDRILYKPPAEE
jgi:hypothetical protein